MRTIVVIIFIGLIPASAFAQESAKEVGYYTQTTAAGQGGNTLNGWTYTTTSGTPYTNINDPTFNVLAYDSQGRIVSYAINGQERVIVYSEDASGQEQTAAAATAQHTANTLNLLAGQRAIDRSIFDRLYTVLLTSHMPGKGLSAGDGPDAAFAAWVDGSYTMQGSTKSGVQNASNQYIILTGLDYTPSERLTLGASAGFNRNQTEFHTAAGGDQRDDYFIFNPYAGIGLWDNAFLGLQAGLKYGRTTLTGKTSADYQSLTTSAGGFLTYAFIWDRFLFSPVVGYTYTFRNPYADAVESSALGMLKAGGRLTWQSERIVPYIDLAYNYDTIGQTDAQRSDMTATAGLDFLPTTPFRISFFVSNTFFRDKEYCTTFDLNLRYSF